MKLWEYAEVMLRWGWVILLATAVCTGGAFALTKLQAPRYTSVAEVSVMPNRLELELSQTVVNLLRNYVSAIQSEGMAKRVVERMGLPDSQWVTIQRSVAAEANEPEFKIIIEATSGDPRVAQRIAQTVAQLFIEDVQSFAQRQDPLDRIMASMLNGGAQAAGQSWPRKKLLLLLGVGSGALLGLLIALYLEWSQVEKVSTPEQVEAWLELPVVASIPSERGPRESKRQA
jgi:uncharacterized protein involved in exopolysaccharide biosynthesis